MPHSVYGISSARTSRQSQLRSMREQQAELIGKIDFLQSRMNGIEALVDLRQRLTYRDDEEDEASIPEIPRVITIYRTKYPFLDCSMDDEFDFDEEDWGGLYGSGARCRPPSSKRHPRRTSMPLIPSPDVTPMQQKRKKQRETSEPKSKVRMTIENYEDLIERFSRRRGTM